MVEIRAEGAVERIETTSGAVSHLLRWSGADRCEFEIRAWLGAEPRVSGRRAGRARAGRTASGYLWLALRHELRLNFSEPLAEGEVQLVPLHDPATVRGRRRWREPTQGATLTDLPPGRYRALASGTRVGGGGRLFGAAEVVLGEGHPVRVSLALQPFALALVRVEGPAGGSLPASVDALNQSYPGWRPDERQLGKSAPVFVSFADEDDAPELAPLSRHARSADPGQLLRFELPPGAWKLRAVSNDPDLGVQVEQLRLAPGEVRRLLLRLPACAPLRVRSSRSLSQAELHFEGPPGVSLRWEDEHTLLVRGLAPSQRARLALICEEDEDPQLAQVCLVGGRDAQLSFASPGRVRIQFKGPKLDPQRLLDLEPGWTEGTGLHLLPQQLQEAPAAVICARAVELPGGPKEDEGFAEEDEFVEVDELELTGSDASEARVAYSEGVDEPRWELGHPRLELDLDSDAQEGWLEGEVPAGAYRLLCRGREVASFQVKGGSSTTIELDPTRLR